jgi:hypothetical protein
VIAIVKFLDTIVFSFFRLCRESLDLLVRTSRVTTHGQHIGEGIDRRRAKSHNVHRWDHDSCRALRAFALCRFGDPFAHVPAGGPPAAASGSILRWKSARNGLWPWSPSSPISLEEIVAAMRKWRIAACRTGAWLLFARHDVSFKKDRPRAANNSGQPWPAHPAAGGESNSCLT